MFLGSTICLVSNIASALSQSWPQLLAFRFLLGIGLALDNSTISIYVAECAPAAIRGGLAVSWQMFTALGIFVAFVANVAVYNVRHEVLPSLSGLMSHSMDPTRGDYNWPPRSFPLSL